jgi:RHS repeat-associated protein
MFLYNEYLQIANTQSASGDDGFTYCIWNPIDQIATRPLCWYTPLQSIQYFTHQASKNVSETVGIDHNVVAHYEYSVFGAETTIQGESSGDNQWRFSSEYEDCQCGVVYFNYRMYHPLDGRWISFDRIDARDNPVASANPYLYVENSPLNGTDFLGLARRLLPSEEANLKNGSIGSIRCNERCELEVYIPDNVDVVLYPRDCLIAHEEQHIRDLQGRNVCKKDESGCCKDAGLFPDASDYGGRENLKNSECEAYLVTASCCAKKARMLQRVGAATYTEMVSLRRCVVAARDTANAKLGIIMNEFRSTCNNQAAFNRLLEEIDAYFIRKEGK